MNPRSMTVAFALPALVLTLQAQDATAPVTALAVTSLGDNSQGAPMFDVTWNANDDASGIKSVTVYVAENGGDFKIWLRQVDPSQSQAVFTGVAGKHYEFLAVAIDNAGNREAASVANAVLPDDGSRQAVLDGLGAERGEQGQIDAANAPRAESDDDQLRDARQEAGHPVAGADALGVQEVGEAGRLLLQLGVGELGALAVGIAELALQARHHAGTHRRADAEGVADGDHVVARLQVGGGAHGGGLQVAHTRCGQRV